MKLLKKALVLIVLASAVISCSKDDTQIPINENGKVYTLTLDVNQTGYDSVNTKSEYQWPDGAKLYIHFSNKENTETYPGIATYSSATGSWTIPAPQGDLNRGDSTACTVVFIDKAIEGEIINLTTDDVVYEDACAKYFLGNETLTIKANLTPKTARIRFKGTAGSTIKLYGTASYTKYNPSYNTFGTTDKEMELEVAPDGYTPYIHTFFPNDVKRLEITDSNNKIFVFKCSSAHLSAGISRYFNIPTTQDKQGWTMHEPVKTFKVKDAEFKMIYVQWINGSFYIAETETTQKLWFAVTGFNPSQFKDDNSDLPVESMNQSEYENFEKKLRSKTGYAFTLPTFDQWLFAAKGGNKSKGYTYSGSNNLDEVAWHKGNSEGITHPVKSKLQNELGLYDMNGNVAEVLIKYDYYLRTQYAPNIGGHCDDENLDYFELNYDISRHSSPFYEYNAYTLEGVRLCINI